MASAAPTHLSVVVTGDRHWDNVACVRSALGHIQARVAPGTTITLHHGGCRGADTQAATEARRRKWAVRMHAAEWGKYKGAAGPRRNSSMLKLANPSIVLVLHPHLERSKGTKDCVNKARKLFKTRQQGSLLMYTGERQLT